MYCSNEYQGYFLESRLHFRIHAALHKLKKIEKERKKAKKLAKASKNTSVSNDVPSDSDTDESDGFSNYNTASEGEEDAFEDAHSDTGTTPSHTVNHFVDGPSEVSMATSKNNNSMNTDLGAVTKKSQNSPQSRKLFSRGVKVSKLKRSPKQSKPPEPKISQSSQQESSGSQVPSLYHETSL